MALALLVAVLGVVSGRPAAAQATTPGSGGARVEVSGSLLWLGPVALATPDAELRANAASPQPLRLFASTTRLAPAPGVSGRIAVGLTRRLDLEGAVAYGRPTVESSLSSDVERAPALTATIPVTEYLVDGGMVLGLADHASTSIVPFVAVGGGIRRQIYEARTLVEQGSAYYVGGGVRRALATRTTGALRAIGWRAGARLYLLRGGLPSGDDGIRRRVRVEAGVFVRF